MTTTVGESGYRDRNTTTDRALTIFGMFSDQTRSVSAMQVAARLEVARSTAYRYLQTLVANEFLEESGTGGFRLGLRILELARIARHSYSVTDLALPAMRDLAHRFDQTVLLTKRTGSSIVCLERQESDSQYVRFSYERGSSLPINAGASALVLLAWSSEEEIRRVFAAQPLRRFTHNTLTSPDALMNRLRAIREAGFSMTLAEVDPDAMGIAAPVFGSDGSVVAAISIVAMQSRLPEGERSAVADAVMAAAAQLSTTLHEADL